MKYLVTGGCGFIGSHLCEALTEAGHDLIILDDLSTGKREQLAPGAALEIGDVSDPAAVHKAMRGVDGCFHLAAIASVERSRAEWARTHQVNLSGSVNVLSAAAVLGGVPVVYASSAAVYGDNPALPLKEDAAPTPLSAYGVDKLGSEMHARIGAGVHGLPSIGLRFFNIYGPRQDPSSPYSGVISIFCQRILSGKPIIIYGDGEQSRDFVYVKDTVNHVMAAMRALHEKGIRQEVLNVCTGISTSVSLLAATIARLASISPDISYATARSGDIRHSLGSPLRASQVLGTKAETSLEIGLHATLESLHS